MNDNELITAVRESVTDVHSPTPVEQIVSRGRAMRARRQFRGWAGRWPGGRGGLGRDHAGAVQPPGQPSTHCPASGLDGYQAGQRRYPRQRPRVA